MRQKLTERIFGHFDNNRIRQKTKIRLFTYVNENWAEMNIFEDNIFLLDRNFFSGEDQEIQGLYGQRRQYVYQDVRRQSYLHYIV